MHGTLRTSSLVAAPHLCYSATSLMEPLPARLTIEALRARVEKRIAGLHRLVVADVMRVFLEVSILECEQMLFSLEFAFDEDDGRIARFEARFADWSTQEPPEELEGYELLVQLPRVIPPREPVAGVHTAAERAIELAGPHGSLVARFVRALADLGAYRSIERLEAVAVDAYLL